MILIGAPANLQGRLYRLVDPIRQFCRNIEIYRHHSKRGPAGASSHDGLARNSTSESDLRIFGLDRPEFQKRRPKNSSLQWRSLDATLFSDIARTFSRRRHKSSYCCASSGLAVRLPDAFGFAPPFLPRDFLRSDFIKADHITALRSSNAIQALT